MSHHREVHISRGAIHLTTLVSVALLLLIIGSVALLGIAARNETRRLQENVELTLVLNDTISDADATELMTKISRYPFIRTISLTDRAAALAHWNDATGENLEELFGANPLSPEIDFTLKADYTSAHQQERICTNLTRLPGVEGVAKPDARFVEAMNNNIRKIMWALGGIAILLVAVSFVLINNTVHLTIYTKRFTIHTMQLVGASDSFIRKPLLLQNMGIGALAGVCATALLGGMLASGDSLMSVKISTLVPWPEALAVGGCLVAMGAIICCGAAYLSSTKYLRKRYEELFR